MEEKTIFDLHSELAVDTFLRVKTARGWVTYIVNTHRKDGSARTYGDLYMYFTTKKEGFRFAMGMILSETYCGKFWQGKTQYLYFDNYRVPELLEPVRIISPTLIFPKRKWEL